MLWGCRGAEREHESVHTSDSKLLTLMAFLSLNGSRGQTRFNLFREVLMTAE